MSSSIDLSCGRWEFEQAPAQFRQVGAEVDLCVMIDEIELGVEDAQGLDPAANDVELGHDPRMRTLAPLQPDHAGR